MIFLSFDEEYFCLRNLSVFKKQTLSEANNPFLVKEVFFFLKKPL